MDVLNKKEIFEVLYDKEKWDVYKKFQEIENSIDTSGYVYNYFDDVKEMLSNEKAYIKLRGFRIICKLAKYDTENKINNCIDILLAVLDDDKPTNVRMCLQVINNLILYKNDLKDKIIDKLKNIDYLKFKDTMSPLIKKDIDGILKKYGM